MDNDLIDHRDVADPSTGIPLMSAVPVSISRVS